jgi:hypothetical protein
MHHHLIDSRARAAKCELLQYLQCSFVLVTSLFKPHPARDVLGAAAQGERKVHEDRWKTAADAAANAGGGSGRTLREIELHTPIR